MNNKPWSISSVWNNQINLNNSKVSPRNYIRASELGSSFRDRFNKMKGVPFSNPFDERTLRIFDTGRFFEQIIVKLLKVAGILHSTQNEITVPADDTHLKVVGHLDCIAGGVPDVEKARQYIQGLKKDFDLSDDDLFLENRALKVAEYLFKEYPDGLEPTIAEVKTVNSMAFWAHKNTGSDGYFKGYDHHKLQLLTYLLGKPKDKNGQEVKTARLFYISKDDLCLQEIAVTQTDELMKQWNDDVEKMTHYFKNNELPPREEDTVWNENTHKYEVNWKLGRSNYLTLITGLSKEAWEKQANNKALGMSWRKRADEHGIDHKDMQPEDIKKAVMSKDREIKKQLKEGGDI